MNSIEEIELSLTLEDAYGEKRFFTGALSLRTALDENLDFWTKAAGEFNNNNRIGVIRRGFQQAVDHVRIFMETFPKWDENQRQAETRSIVNIRPYIKDTIFSDNPFAAAFLDALKVGLPQGDAFWAYVINHPGGSVHNIPAPAIEGAILGYEFMFQGDTNITRRRDIEKRNFAAMRKDLADKSDELITKTNKFQHELKIETDAFKEGLTEWRDLSQEDWSGKLNSFFEDANARLVTLEKLYTEKLRLEKPAEYWSKKAADYKTSGRCWGMALILATAVSGVMFANLFLEWMNSGKIIEKFSAQHWQGIILLAAVLSLLAFLIRTFGRLTFSSFHLQRDAEEREQLAYVYLALAKETEFSDESRKIVLQALFSRSETGLLSGDHGPTMPAVNEVITKMKSGE